MSISLAVVQFERSSGMPEVNLAKMSDLLDDMPSADIILLPEVWLCTSVIEEDYHNEVLEHLRGMLPGADTVLASGAHYVRSPAGVLSTGAFISRSSTAFYDKLYPSNAVGERAVICPGVRSPVIVHRGIKLAAAVCVDLFYPEVVRRLALEGALIILNPANIPAARLNLWRCLGVARAAENTVYTVMANNTGTRYADGREVAGGSFAVGPDGIFFSEFGAGAGIYTVELDLDLIDRTRRRWKYLEDIGG